MSSEQRDCRPACVLTVLMSVHNGARHVARAIESILAQTFERFEFLIIDDGSTDDTLSIIRSFKDERIRVVTRENRGLTASLNEGISLARGLFVARQDADDISLPTRLEREIRALQDDPELGLIGTNYKIIDEADAVIGETAVFVHPDDLAVAEILSNQYGHGSVVFRRDLVERLGGYDESVGHVEDYDLFVRIARIAKIANIAEPLYLWRRSGAGISLSNRELQTTQAFAVRDREFSRVLGEGGSFRVVFHPRGFRPSTRAYLEKKSTMYRDLAYLYRANRRRRQSLLMQGLATIHAPWKSGNFRKLAMLLLDRSDKPLWEYEFL